jgi:hypothetical protein
MVRDTRAVKTRPPDPKSQAKIRRRNLSFLATSALTPDPDNPRKHPFAQVLGICRSIQAFGFNQPILVDRNRRIIAGHGRHAAALHLGLTEVPVIFLDDLTEAEAKGYLLADNKTTDNSAGDPLKLAEQLKDLTGLNLEFDIEATGFQQPEIDFHIQSLQEQDVVDRADEFTFSHGPAVSIRGDLWLLGDHRLLCGDALEPESYIRLLSGEKAAACFTDVPYNVKIAGHASGKGRMKHREFAMASGEMSEEQYTTFLSTVLTLILTHTARGALTFFAMDWRHAEAALAARRASGFEMINLCVWCKTNSGMGSLYRSGHEFVFVFRNGSEAHQNNVQLGRFGRNRSNHWSSAFRDLNALSATWILPIQSKAGALGAVHSRFLASLTRSGASVLWCDQNIGPLLGPGFEVSHCSGPATSRNESGLALTLGHCPIRALLPGDASPGNAVRCDCTIDHLVVPHHGGRISLSPLPAPTNIKSSHLIYSYGVGNIFLHPLTDMRRKIRKTWKRNLPTALRDQTGFGHVGIDLNGKYKNHLVPPLWRERLPTKDIAVGLNCGLQLSEELSCPSKACPSGNSAHCAVAENMANCTERPATQCRSNPVSGRRLRKTGIFQ